MEVLVAYLSLGGPARRIAESIGWTLRSRGLRVHVRDIRTMGISGLLNYDAFIIGSDLYLGRWPSEAARFVARHRHVLSRMPCWVFTGGPTGFEMADGPGAVLWGVPDAEEVQRVRRSVSAFDHRVFLAVRHRELPEAGGVFEEIDSEGMPELPEGVRAWAGGIARALTRSSLES